MYLIISSYLIDQYLIESMLCLPTTVEAVRYPWEQQFTFSTEVNLMVYKTLLKPIWTCGIDVCHILHKDLNIPFVRDLIPLSFVSQINFHAHLNPLASEILTKSCKC